MKPDVWIPDGLAEAAAFARTTHMGVVAHPDDLEIEGYPGIVECFGRDDRWFCGVVVTDGAGSARGGPYATVSDEEMVAIRRKEQHKAAMVGEYGAMVMLGATSAAIKDPGRPGVVEALADLLRRARPEVVYTHNLADKHDTHVAVSLSVIDACRSLPADQRPRRLLGGEGLAGPRLAHRRRQGRAGRVRPREPLRRPHRRVRLPDHRGQALRPRSGGLAARPCHPGRVASPRRHDRRSLSTWTSRRSWPTPRAIPWPSPRSASSASPPT